MELIMTLHDPLLHRAEVPELRLGGLGIRLLVEAQTARGAFSLVEHPLAPRSLGAPLHTHSREDEWSFVTEGTIGVMVGDTVIEAHAGNLVFKPRGVPHAFWNASDAPARIVEVIAPGGFEGYFRDMAVIMGPNGPDPVAAARICEHYGLEMDLGSIPQLHERFGLACPVCEREAPAPV
jgi:quercetin dioxygenase-like cupin family protein